MITQGNSIRIPLRDESVHACISSFPYFGLRSYGLPPTIWGGDSLCRHQWQVQVQKRGNGGERDYGSYDGVVGRGPAVKLPESAFCQLCGAWLGCFGLEPTIALHVQNAVLVSREIKRVLRRDGVFWLNYGDSFATGKNGRSASDTKAAGKDDRTFRDKPFSITELPAKNLCMIPFRVALALQDDGWIVRSEIPWLKKNSMPSSVTDRPGTAHEHVFMLVKSARYYFDMEAVRRRQSETTFKRFGNGVPRVKGTKAENANPADVLSTMDTPLGILPAGRALRTSDPFFDSLDAYIAHLQDVRDNGGMLVDSEGLPAALVVNTESFGGLHYATFPRKLIAPLIQTTPEKCCPKCGKAWERVVESEKVSDEKPSRGNKNQAPEVFTRGGNQANFGRAGDYLRTTTGWRATCKCYRTRNPIKRWRQDTLQGYYEFLLEFADELKELNVPEIHRQPTFERIALVKPILWSSRVATSKAPTVSAILLDPFCGSGTVGAVANELGRRFIGIDLSAKYLTENALPRSEKLTSFGTLKTLPMFADLDEAA